LTASASWAPHHLEEEVTYARARVHPEWSEKPDDQLRWLSS